MDTYDQIFTLTFMILYVYTWFRVTWTMSKSPQERWWEFLKQRKKRVERQRGRRSFL